MSADIIPLTGKVDWDAETCTMHFAQHVGKTNPVLLIELAEDSVNWSHANANNMQLLWMASRLQNLIVAGKL